MGDLISREAFANLCRQIARAQANARVFTAADAWEGAAEQAEKFPAADAVEVVHGRWGEYVVVGYNGINVIWARLCSECGYENLASATNYCPKCGAKMDGGKKNDAGQAF